jgi:adenylosuccinate lyase
VAYPQIDWRQFEVNLWRHFRITPLVPTTQIEYDHFAAFFDSLKELILLLSIWQNIWTYVSMEYFKQKIKAGEIGSSAMPQSKSDWFWKLRRKSGNCKCNFEHLSAKLPISRLQRDLTDSTVLRNIGVPLDTPSHLRQR